MLTNEANSSVVKVPATYRRDKILTLKFEDGLSDEEIVVEMRKLDDSYDEIALRRDFVGAMKFLSKDLKLLADKYLVIELTKLDNNEKRLIQSGDILFDRLSESLVSGSSLTVGNLTRLTNQIAKISNTLLNIQARRAAYLGLDAPKKVDIHSQNVNFSIEDLQNAKKQAENEFLALKQEIQNNNNLQMVRETRAELVEVIETELE